jgi:hypothetical protein
MSNTHNPNVGPRTFSRAEGDRFFGREREARELLSLVISERVVLFYAKSGAGKSSLINTRLVPHLQEAGFAVLPVGRVSGSLPPGLERPANIFIFNLMAGLDQGHSDSHRFLRLPLTEFLAHLTSSDGENYYCSDEPLGDAGEYEATPYVLIIDQFEEILTTQPGCWSDRENFFRQLNQALTADPYLWVVLTIREDFAAALDPYAYLLPNNLRARFHLQRPAYEAALEAVQKPAELGGRPFAPGVAETLVDNLRQVWLPGHANPQPGQFIEPVQLQVVCYQLWESLKTRPAGEISQTDLPLDYISQALCQFYETVIYKVARQTGVSQLTLREWFQTQLITEANTRGTVYRGEKESGGLKNEAADLLLQFYLLRSEMRAGGTWYELTHDRFIEPILKSNAGWQIVRLKRWTGTSLGFSTFLLIGLLVALALKYLSPRK